MNTLHLPIERMAELADGVAAPAERDHLAMCKLCAAELDAYRTLVTLAADERRRIGHPSTNWDSLREALSNEGLLAVPGRAVRARNRTTMWLLRVAGVAALLATGVVMGRISAGATGPNILTLGPAVESVTPGDGGFLTVSNPGNGFGSTQEALDQLERAQRAYEEAAAYLASHESGPSYGSDQYRTRLAALDMASETFQRALTDAPEDPIINQYLLATMNAREATIRRIGTTLPASMRMGRF